MNRTSVMEAILKAYRLFGSEDQERMLHEFLLRMSDMNLLSITIEMGIQLNAEVRS